MAILVEGQCLDDQAGRVLMAASAPRVSSVSASGDLVQWELRHEDPDGFSGEQWLYVKTINGDFDAFVYANVLEVPCDPAESVADGVALGWLVGSALIGAAIFKLMQRAMS
ncbi:hypothetical protein [Methyloversatilis sp. NSM2]|uniref:hypothetical protein n=1 Tax=Methyloversatilis sp. NSM2 TaxID=3134135 RepID=UPI003111EBAB